MAWEPSTDTRAATGASAPSPDAAARFSYLSEAGAAPFAPPSLAPAWERRPGGVGTAGVEGSGAARAAGPAAPERPGTAPAGAGAARARRPNGSSATGAQGRDPFLDNAKFLLTVLVVMGHNWIPVVDAKTEGMPAVKAAFLLVYAIHMPGLVLLCGYLSRGFDGRPEQVRSLLGRILLPYLLFEAAYSGVYTLFWDQPFRFTPSVPRYLCWFLVALFLWRLSVPLWRAVRRPVAIAAAVSVLAGFTDLGGELALPRVLMLLPWFVLGLRLRPEHLRPLRNPAARRWALPVMVVGGAGAWWVAPRVSRHWLLMDAGSADLGVQPLVYAGMRIALFGVSAVLIAAFLALVPSRRTGFTALGACTLYPFLLHGLLVKTVEGLGGYEPVRAGGALAVAGTTVLAGLVAVLLCAPPVRRVLWPLVEPYRLRGLRLGIRRAAERDERAPSGPGPAPRRAHNAG
ncbi:acyltransferase family protein [Streptomyces cacaoi]|uniref:acyltransferase family protein n=1 Tax=Streptomyces cacaoi TaxID=1898 RepID=UPI00332F4953